MFNDERIQDRLSLALYQMVNQSDEDIPAEIEVDEVRVREKFIKTLDQIALPPRSEVSTYYPDAPQDTRTLEEIRKDVQEARFKKAFMKGLEEAMSSPGGMWKHIYIDED